MEEEEERRAGLGTAGETVVLPVTSGGDGEEGGESRPESTFGDLA